MTESIMAVLFERIEQLDTENKQLRQKLIELANGPKMSEMRAISLSNLRPVNTIESSENRSKQTINKTVESILKYAEVIGF